MTAQVNFDDLVDTLKASGDVAVIMLSVSGDGSDRLTVSIELEVFKRTSDVFTVKSLEAL